MRLKYDRDKMPAVSIHSVLLSVAIIYLTSCAERLMMQANAQIGLAIAAYFPTLNLTANGSFVGGGLSHWISMPQLGWAYWPRLAKDGMQINYEN